MTQNAKQTPETKGSTYAASGVDYAGTLDPAKLIFQTAARETVDKTGRNDTLNDLKMRELSWSRGESVYLTRIPGGFVQGFVIEGLGTKNCVADEMYKLTGVSYDAAIGQDNVAMVLNDLCTLGIRPVTFAFKLDNSSQDSFLKNLERVKELARGTKEACIEAGCIWGPSETATLKDIVMPNAIELCGAASGFAHERHVLNPANIQAGDAMVFVESSGVHANGLTLARGDVVNNMPKGYMTEIGDGQKYGEALLTPTHLYANLMAACQDDAVYAINVTGHGLRKLMRAPQPFAYIVDKLIPAGRNPIFHAIQQYGNVEEKEMYGNYNMGIGWVIICRPQAAGSVIGAATLLGKYARVGGYVEESAEKKVMITEKNITFRSSDLAIR